MDMSGSGSVFSVPSEHLPGLVALLAVVLLGGTALFALRALATKDVGWATKGMASWDRLSFAARAALFGVVVGGAVHAALVPTHWSDERTIALLFIADVAGFVVAAVWVLGSRRRWPELALVMLGGTVAVYAWYLVTGREDADLVGLATTTVELAAALVVLVAVLPSHVTGASSRRRHSFVTALGALLVALLAMSGLAAASSTTSTADASASAGTPSKVGSSMAGMSGSSASSRPLSLPTTSAAGPITWPDDMSTMAAGMEMATPGCTAQPSTVQQQAAVELVDKTVATAAPYQSLAAAKAAGYVPVTPTGRRVVHYINPSIYRRGATLDPQQIPVLVYVNTSHGAVLSAAMYLMPRAATSAHPPQPGGCLTQWHIHTDLCFSGGGVVGNDQTGGCAVGSVNRTTAPMMHVWMTPVPGGPLAPDPPARDEVAAASQMTTSGTPNGIA
jgi:hypothetical protein